LVRVEVQARRKDAALIRALASTLRGGADKAEVLRSTLAKVLVDPEVMTAFDVFGSELPDQAFAGVFDPHTGRGDRNQRHRARRDPSRHRAEAAA
jgi:hypothetical protein